MVILNLIFTDETRGLSFLFFPHGFDPYNPRVQSEEYKIQNPAHFFKKRAQYLPSPWMSGWK